MKLNEAAIAAIKATGGSMKDFKIRQELVDLLKNNDNVWVTSAQVSGEEIRSAEYTSQMINHLLYSAHNAALGESMAQKILPVNMEVNGELIKVGEALIEVGTKGSCIMHAIIEGEHNVTELLKADLTQLSIGNRDDFKYRPSMLRLGEDGHVTDAPPPNAEFLPFRDSAAQNPFPDFNSTKES